MFKTNDYFDGKVKSIALKSDEGDATIGVMAAGEYEFGTSTVEVMTVMSGKMSVQLPGESVWKEYKKLESFTVDKGEVFKAKVEVDTPYLCVYK